MSSRLSAALFRELRTTIKNAQFGAIKTTVEGIEQDMKVEFDNILRDLRSAAVEEGEVSESQRFPETAAAIDLGLDRMDGLIARCQDIINVLSP
jgi:hypothetical protein